MDLQLELGHNNFFLLRLEKRSSFSATSLAMTGFTSKPVHVSLLCFEKHLPFENSSWDTPATFAVPQRLNTSVNSFEAEINCGQNTDISYKSNSRRKHSDTREIQLPRNLQIITPFACQKELDRSLGDKSTRRGPGAKRRGRVRHGGGSQRLIFNRSPWKIYLYTGPSISAPRDRCKWPNPPPPPPTSRNSINRGWVGINYVWSACVAGGEEGGGMIGDVWRPSGSLGFGRVGRASRNWNWSLTSKRFIKIPAQLPYCGVAPIGVGIVRHKPSSNLRWRFEAGRHGPAKERSDPRKLWIDCES